MESEIFQSKLSTLSADAFNKYRRGICSFESFLTGHGLSISNLSSDIVDDWAYDLLLQNKPKSTVIRNLNILSSCLKTEELISSTTSAFRARELAHRFEIHGLSILPLMRKQLLDKCLAEVQSWVPGNSSDAKYSDAFLFSLISGIDLKETIAIRKDCTDRFNGFQRILLKRNISPSRKYVFDLNQSYRTVNQIYKELSGKLSQLFSKCGIETRELNADEFLNSLWVGFALRCGARASEAFGCSGGSAKYVIPDFIKYKPVDANIKTFWAHAIESIINHDTSCWFALHMRKGISYCELQKEIQTNIHPAPLLFYPCEKIAKNVHNKRVLSEHPFILRTVFFKTTPQTVPSMFAKIGDKAWCYRIFNSADAPYSVIPKDEMLRFQAAIGHFTPDTQIYPLGQLSLKPEDKVVLLMGEFFDQEAKVSKVLSKKEGNVIYRVVFRDKSGFEWAVDADSRQLQLSN